MRLFVRGLALLAMAPLCTPLAGLAQPAAPQVDEPGNKIVVEGQRLTRQQVRERANSFIRTLGVVQGERSVARWGDGVCPHVRGVAPDIAKMVEAKVRAIATAVGAPLAKADCETNLLIAFVADGREMTRMISQRQPNAMSQVHGPERRDLEKGDAPIRWWYTIANGQGAGGPIGDTPPPATYGNAEGGGSALPDGIPMSSGYTSSIIRPQTVRSIAAATVVIDVNRAEGITLTAASAYAAFVGLAEVNNGAAPPVASILNLFGERGRADDLSFWDNQFLNELYDLPLSRFGRVQRGYLVRAMAQGGGEEDGEVKADAPQP